ncbi:hypothetical protein B0H63DRAFT_462453 [Podospora didyma]|uniref:AAA+ ATPase domain-containing protein n=1 Tax=Podospora didyma TaxID=330526 RepID=A0AAE0P7T6_9PEZI|nr:hypothetical protein B0H63DRAFT_462453 [Podospora didyma]
MDENGTKTKIPSDTGVHPAVPTMPEEKLTVLRNRMQRAENLIQQMAGLQQAITRELAELSSEIGYPFRVSALESVKPENVHGDGGSGETGNKTSRAGDALAQVTAGVFSDSTSAELLLVSAEEEEENLAAATPEVAVIPWGRMTTTLRGVAQYAAIEVSSNEPIGTFDPGTAWNRFSDPSSPSNRGGLLPDRIQINSPCLKALLKQIFGDDAETVLGAPAAKPLILLRPFKMLVYHEKSIKNLLTGVEESDDSEDSINELRVLDSVVESTLWPCKENLETVADTAAFSDLWYIFSHGSPIYVQHSDYAQKVWRIIQRTGGRRYLNRPDHIPESAFKHQISPFVIDCYFVDFDGRRYVPIYGRFEILPYHGVRTLTSLPAFPLRIALKNGMANRKDLISRGREFVSYAATVAHRYYDGWGHTRAPDGRKQFPELEEKFDSEVIVDFGLTLEQRPDWRPSGKETDLYEMDRSELGDPSQNIDQDWVYDRRFADRVLTNLRETLHSLQEQQAQPDDEFLLLLPDRVFGFVLRSRKFASFRTGASPDGFRPLMHLRHEEDAWSKLHLPQGHRQMIQTLVQSHQGRMNDEPLTAGQDLVLGKGRGLIILLHGAPGTGKTLTAECAALSTKRPLFSMACADLGTSAPEVEASLGQNFHLAHKWGCVLLLDEADTFLSTRTRGELVRSSLVSVFLRMLEYYSGILFLTTNRVGDFDEAFKSRIHISLYYPDLDRTGTLTIWKSNIQRLGSRPPPSHLLIDESELIHYAEKLFDRQQQDGTTWNGREIRNAFQSALALAEFGLGQSSAVCLKPDHFESIYQSFKQFQRYAVRTSLSKTDLITPKPQRANSSTTLPAIRIDRDSKDTAQQPGSMSSSDSDVSDSDGHPQFPPPWQYYHRPDRHSPSEAAFASTAHQRQPFPPPPPPAPPPPHDQQQQQTWYQPQEGGPFSYPPPAMYYYPPGMHGLPPLLPFQAMPGKPSMTLPNPFVDPPLGRGSHPMHGSGPHSISGIPPQVFVGTSLGRGSHTMYGSGSHPIPGDPPEALPPTNTTNEPFDWLGDKMQNLLDVTVGASSEASTGYKSSGKRRHKRPGPDLF